MESGQSPTTSLEHTLPSALFDIHLQDARNLGDYIRKYTKNKEFIDVTITSPPYHDILSYDNIDNQIGYGQNYDIYLQDLGFVFKDIYDLTKDEGSLWIIVDSFSRNKELVLLPFEIISILKKQGWILRSIFIWKKDKTRPWVKKGQFRKIFEYVLFFVKSQDYKFNIDRIREINFDEYKEWWVKYPERYNPKGKIPTNVWEYPIPVQGRWGNQELNHSNPLPSGLVHRILTIVSDENDIVCDPFSGTGTVLAVANAMNRKYLGFELNESYINTFNNTIKTLVKEEITSINLEYSYYKAKQKELSDLIINLRLVKFPKSVFKKMIDLEIIDENSKKHLNTIFAIAKNTLSNYDVSRTILASEDLYFIFSDKTPFIENNDFNDLDNEREVTRYQLYAKYYFKSINEIDVNKFLKDQNELWLYSSSRAYKYDDKISLNKWFVNCRKNEWAKKFYNYMPPIISNILVNQKLRQSWISKEEASWLRKKQLEDILNDEWKN